MTFSEKLWSMFGTSEFWFFLATAAVEASSAPVPEEMKLFGWGYVIARIVSKVAKKFFPPSVEEEA